MSCSSPLGGLPHAAAIVSVEVSGQLFLVTHTTGFNEIREAQGPEGQGLHSPLNQLDVTTPTCCICLKGGSLRISINLWLLIAGFDSVLFCIFNTLSRFFGSIRLKVLNI